MIINRRQPKPCRISRDDFSVTQLNADIGISNFLGMALRWLLLFAAPLCSAASLEVQVLNIDNRGVGDFVVYLETVNKPFVSVPANSSVIISQKDKAFAPYIRVVSRGSSLSFSNKDDITHHIYSIAGPSRFSFRLRAGASKTDLEFRQSGVIAMGCNIHDWMSGYLLILDSSHFAMTDSTGNATLQVEQPGRYRVVAWHPQMREQLEQQITLPETTTLTLTLRHTMAEIPQQKSINDFDFLEGY